MAAWPVVHGVSGQQWKRHGTIQIAHNHIRQFIGINFAPRYRFSRRCARETAGVGPRICKLKKIIVPEFGDTENLLDLRFGLEHEVLRTSTANDQHAMSSGFAARTAGTTRGA